MREQLYSALVDFFMVDLEGPVSFLSTAYTQNSKSIFSCSKLYFYPQISFLLFFKGIFFVMPCIESYQKVDLRTITLGVPPQEVLTRDSVTVSVDAVVYYKVSNATVSVANVENAHHSTRLLAQTSLRNILGTKSLQEILSDRESISGSMQTVLDEATTAWGIKVERVEM